jgi:Flp pilus assembly protein TadG
MKTNAKKRGSSERGAAYIELALTLPVLFLCLFGIIQWGYIFGAYITIRNAAMVGARSAALFGSDANTIDSKVRASLSPTLDSSFAACAKNSCVNCPVPALNADSKCTITYPFKLFLPFVVPNATNGKLTIVGATTMR